MQLLFDQGLARDAAELLRQSGTDTIHVSEIGFSRATDETILQHALTTQRIVVTLDADFHALLAESKATQPSVIRIRIERLKADALSKLLQTVLPQCEEELQLGAIVTVQPGRIRIHRLPVY